MQKRRKLLIVLLTVALLAAALGTLAAHPFAVQHCEVPEETLSAILAQSRGRYSNRLPLLPVYVSVESYAAGRVLYTIHYFPFGTVGMSYRDGDGFNQEKPLTGLQ